MPGAKKKDGQEGPSINQNSLVPPNVVTTKKHISGKSTRDTKPAVKAGAPKAGPVRFCWYAFAGYKKNEKKPAAESKKPPF